MSLNQLPMKKNFQTQGGNMTILDYFKREYPDNPWDKQPYNFEVSASLCLDDKPEIMLQIKWKEKQKYKNFILRAKNLRAVK